VVRTESFNRGALSEVTIRNLNSGVYEMRAQLWSGPNGTGTLQGTLRKTVDLCSNSSSIVTASAAAVAKVAAWPPTPTITTLQTIRVVAEPRAADESPVFAPAAVTFSATGPASVNSSGMVLPTAVGAVNVRATSGALFGESAVTVNAALITRSKWTVLVFLNAANDLYAASTLNMNQMEEVAGNPDVRFVVQWKQSQALFPSSSFDGVRRYLVQPDLTSSLNSQLLQSDLRGPTGAPLDMGDPLVLRDFIVWAKTNFPADRYCMVFWNHGSGWPRSVENELTRGFSFDDATGNSISTWEFDEALNGQSFDIIAWDCSLMQMVEVAYELRTYAPFVVGSEESPPADGYPYDDVFRAFRDNPSRSTRDLTKSFVDAMINHPPYATRKITQSSLDTSKLGALAVALDTLAGELIANRAALTSAIPVVRNTSQSYSPTASRYFRDIKDLCEKLEAHVDTPASVRTASAAVRTALNQVVVWEASNSNSPRSHGLSIDFSPQDFFGSVAASYRLMDFGKDTRWDEWLSQAP
jgi:hypothetical protein